MSGSTLHVHLLPALTTPEALRGGTVVVIDVLRATTTITFALAAGCREVIPCLETEEAKARATSLPADRAVLGGERDGVRIVGFDLGNSPAEYTTELVVGKSILFTTTNGTRAMQSCRLAKRVLIGAFVNLSAVCQSVALDESIHLLCAGTQGQVTREDALLAVAIADRLCQSGGRSWDINDQARMTIDAWRAAAAASGSNASGINAAALAAQLRDSRGGRNLIDIGLDRDLLDVAQVDRFSTVGVLHLDRWTITST